MSGAPWAWQSDLSGVLTAIDLSRTIVRRIYLNLTWALLYNVIGIPVAAGLFMPVLHTAIPPYVAGAAMALSSVSVLTSSLLLKRYRKPRLGQGGAILSANGAAAIPRGSPVKGQRDKAAGKSKFLDLNKAGLSLSKRTHSGYESLLEKNGHTSGDSSPVLPRSYGSITDGRQVDSV
jgi:hypothetical protein